VSAREIRLSDLVGRVVRDADGHKVGRIEELRAEIALEGGRNEYDVVEIHVGAYGALEALAGARFLRALSRRLGRAAGYESRRIPWDRLDLGDPEHPRLRGDRGPRTGTE
jgi:sporulation protein YlmC with PRC-barrel domain